MNKYKRIREEEREGGREEMRETSCYTILNIY